ncbi:hypothetical protein AC578_2894 [Pseudocercospora eumusae]|uniref:F-box domain-containing protein n=1 Tax=Pseudocercospora eumusae TaxID=321146 RepID=A0A139GY63_9PEZI|nr:hypothetical protein AC578_2894 [Pseudocercospora eumusae]
MLESFFASLIQVAVSAFPHICICFEHHFAKLTLTVTCEERRKPATSLLTTTSFQNNINKFPQLPTNHNKHQTSRHRPFVVEYQSNPVKEKMSPLTNNNPTTKTTTHLLTLPAELRLTIYEFLLRDLPHHLHLRKKTTTTPQAFRLNFLNTCALIRKEALPLYAKELDRILANARTCVTRLKEKSQVLDYWWLRTWELGLGEEFEAVDGEWSLVQRRLGVVEDEYARVKKVVVRERRKVRDAFLEMEVEGVGEDKEEDEEVVVLSCT